MKLAVAALATYAWLLACPAAAQHAHDAAAPADQRAAVPMPAHLRLHTLAHMREHLQAIGEIQAALGRGAFDRASQLAEQQLGMTSLKTHGSDEVAPYMPAPMQRMGNEMHRAGSRLALEIANASATGNLRGPLEALGELSAQCVACHASYRLQ